MVGAAPGVELTGSGAAPPTARSDPVPRAPARTAMPRCILYAPRMGFHPGAASRVPGVGTIDYRLQRHALLTDIEAGRVGRGDVCDAHPDLLRAARHGAPGLGETCPICEDAEVVRVCYVFGPRLPPGGRCVLTAEEIARYRQRSTTYSCYEIEVCTACGWNHLRRRIIL